MGTVLEIFGWMSLFLAAVLGPVVAYIMVEAYYYQMRLGPGLERDHGFKEGAAYLFFQGRFGEGHHSAVAIQEVTDGGVFAQAGFRAGDVLPDVTHTGLFKHLHRHRGQQAELAVVEGGKRASIW